VLSVVIKLYPRLQENFWITIIIMSVDWEEIRNRLPTSRTPEDKQKRVDLFRQFDVNSNGFLSLAEVDKGVKDVLQVEALFDAKPVLIRAFTTAKAVNGTSGQTDYVVFPEFRLLLVYMKHYLELWDMFEVISDNGRRIDLAEFKKALSQMEKWGHAPVEHPEEEFKAIDTNGGGYILFDEFAGWALHKHLHLEKDYLDDDF
jgi:Ca2+-binding EF-hand superfamily protein